MSKAGGSKRGPHGARSTGSPPIRPSSLAESIADERWIKFFYLDHDVEELVGYLASLKFNFVANSRDVPFTAQVRGYQGAEDSGGELWLLKEIEEEEALAYKQCEIAYFLDFMLETLSAPTLLVRKDERFYRATKVIVDAVQISSYNYLEEPLRRVMANDLINRWLMFDEDRNPNNYMVIHSVHGAPLVVAIDFNKADFLTPELKITGNPQQFGWFRKEKTRFLTLLKPENFAGYSIDDFAERLHVTKRLSAAKLKRVCTHILDPVAPDAAKRAGRIAKNVIMRRDYIDAYFRAWFKPRDEKAAEKKHSEYEDLGKNFVDFYEKKI